MIFYTLRLESLQAQLSLLLKKKTQLGWARFLTMLSIAIGIYFLVHVSILYTIIVTIILLAIFIKFVYADTDNKALLQHTKHLIQINEDELKALAGDYSHFENGAEYIPQDHLYANDIDILGRASLFQYINRTTSDIGAETLSSWILQPATEKTILQRQESVKELNNKINWQQELQAFGKEKKITKQTQKRLQNWLTQENIFTKNNFWLWARYLVPLIIMIVIVLNIFSLLSNPVRNYFLLASAVLAYFIAKNVIEIYSQVSRMVDELDVMADSIQLIEKAEFKTTLLRELQSAFIQKNSNASTELKALKNILARFDYRLNPIIFIPLAILLQWDLQQVIALEKWKKRNQQNITHWFAAVGELEAICSLTVVHFNHPNWCFALLQKEHFYINGTNIGHPLINETKRVNNYINIEHTGELMLITGSNMAGKSTYLRSIGINVALAMAGSVVCADAFSLSPVQLMTSMRISDNLEENTSTFYAELKKLKGVIDKVNNNEKVFILLDEILRGTNSLDRHTGSKALIQQLIKHHANGIIATHDIELAKLKEEYPNNILNYYFDVQVSNDELYFDYRLKEGICNSLNASILMKKIGIEL
jgi:hypothetical protein